MELRKITNEIVEGIEEIKAILMKELATEDMLTSMTPEGLICIQKSLKLIDQSSMLMKEYAILLENQDKKLDMILDKLEDKA